jgi:hypothetical protein
LDLCIGAIEGLNAAGQLSGWALSRSEAHKPVDVIVRHDGRLVGAGTANRFRKDLASAMAGPAIC